MDDDPEDDVGRVLDHRYFVRRLVARTGLGEVHEATHRFTERTVAIKRLGRTIAAVPRFRERLLREARFLGSAKHPGIVTVLDAGEMPGGAPYMVMEMLEGRALDGMLTTRTVLGAEQTASLGIEICEALAYAHGRGVVHRDVKPSNIILSPEGSGGSPKLIDFGIATAGLEREGEKLTSAGEILGTAEYMAPEQLFAQEVDHRCDVYALGATLFECLTGNVPFPGKYPEVLVGVAKSTEAPSAHRARPAVPLAISEVISRALAKSPDDRFQDTLAFAKALRSSTAAPKTSSQAPELRRRYVRAPYVTPVRVLRGEVTVLDGRSEDISEGGMLILGPHLLENDAKVSVRFASPVSGAIINVPATARWVRTARGGKGAIGIEFVDLADSIREAIGRYVSLLAKPTAEDGG